MTNEQYKVISSLLLNLQKQVDKISEMLFVIQENVPGSLEIKSDLDKIKKDIQMIKDEQEM